MRSRVLACLMVVAGAAAACLPSFDHLDDGTESADASGIDAALPDSALPGDSGGPIVGDGGDAAAGDLPISCKDARDRGLRVIDGDLTIDPDGTGPLKPFVVFCRDMSTNPREFLTLVNTTDPNGTGAFASGTNISGWAMGPGGGSTSCLCAPDVVRAFTKVRLKLAASTVKIDITDTTYSKTNRAGDQPTACELAKPGSCQAFAPVGSRFGTAACCIEGSGPIGRANVDLRGTVFSIALTEVGNTEGNAASGSTMYLNGTDGTPRKQAEMHGGGSCGFQTAGKSGSEIVLTQDGQ